MKSVILEAEGEQSSDSFTTAFYEMPVTASVRHYYGSATFADHHFEGHGYELGCRSFANLNRHQQYRVDRCFESQGMGVGYLDENDIELLVTWRGGRHLHRKAKSFFAERFYDEELT